MNFVSRLDQVCPLIFALKSKSKSDCLAHQASVTMLNMLYIHTVYVYNMYLQIPRATSCSLAEGIAA